MVTVGLIRPDFENKYWEWDPLTGPLSHVVTSGAGWRVTAYGKEAETICLHIKGIRGVNQLKPKASITWTGEDAVFILNNFRP